MCRFITTQEPTSVHMLRKRTCKKEPPRNSRKKSMFGHPTTAYVWFQPSNCKIRNFGPSNSQNHSYLAIHLSAFSLSLYPVPTHYARACHPQGHTTCTAIPAPTSLHRCPYSWGWCCGSPPVQTAPTPRTRTPCLWPPPLVVSSSCPRPRWLR